MLKVKFDFVPRCWNNKQVKVYNYQVSPMPIFEGSFKDAHEWLTSQKYYPLCDVENTWVRPKILTMPPIIVKMVSLFEEVIKVYVRIKLETFTRFGRDARRSVTPENSSTASD